MGSVVEEEEPVPLAPLVRASSSNALLLSFPEVVSTSKVKEELDGIIMQVDKMYASMYEGVQIF